VLTNFFADANDAFSGGRLGMMVTSTSSFPQLSKGAKFDLRMAPVPAMDGGRPTGVTSTNGFVITTKDPARQRATCRALLATLTPDAVTQTVKATATLPLNRAALDPAHLGPFYQQHPDWIAVRDQATVPWQSLPGGSSAEYAAKYTDLQTHVLLGQQAPADAARELETAARALLDKK
jgi:multiple sugar transport system substrate-binding protein